MSWIEIDPPKSDEFDPYYAGYIERVHDRRLSLVLRQQRAAVLELLAGLTDEQAGYRYAPDKWSIKEVIGHLVDCERVFVYRAMSIARGERQSLPGFDQDAYVVSGGFDARQVSDLAREYETVRNASLSFFDSLAAESWLARGRANEVEVSVRAIGYIVPGHEAHHLAVIEERYLDGI
jgi:hypothetical protein